MLPACRMTGCLLLLLLPRQVRQAREGAQAQLEAAERREMEALVARDEARKRRRAQRLAGLAAQGLRPVDHWPGCS